MSRWVFLSALCLLLVVGCSSTPPKNRNDICSIFEQKRGWYDDARDASERWGTPVHVMMAILKHESSFRAKAKTPRKKYLGFIPGARASSAYGYPQALDGTWDTYKRDTGHRWADRDDFDDAIDFVGWYTSVSHRKLGISKSSAYHQYLAYHEGQGGYAKGTYKRKRWLMNYAKQVEKTSNRYAAQLKQCG
ncbi:MAG TPA: hypothetical protein DDW45_10045 [Gammaproteobacteria bacterium]|nr:hypothetical protein [Gammaproteobacteria bacterium]